MALMSRMHSQGAIAPRHPNSLTFWTPPKGARRVPATLALTLAAAAAMLGGCSNTQSVVSSAFGPLSAGSSDKASGGPMFPESKWGVSASRRVAADGDHIPKGGGRYKVGDPYRVGGRWYNPREQTDYDRVGIASWYGSDFHGRHTANGEVFDMNALTAAHPTLPMPSYAYVTNLSNNRTVLVRINDRGPYVGDRVIDLSRKSADALGLRSGGTGKVRVRYAGRAPLDGSDHHERQFLASRPWNGGGTDIAAMERAQSAREWDAYRRAPNSVNPNPVTQSQASAGYGYGPERPAPERYAASASERFPAGYTEQPAGYTRTPLPDVGAAQQPSRDQGYGQSYADAGPDAGRIWTPHEYRAALNAR
jgi:rare lipoprotein A